MLTDRFAEYLGIFADVAREGSFSGASRRRGITPSSVARQIDALETHLETSLFLRSTRLLTLTESGQALLVRARRVLNELDDAQQEIASMKGEVQGVLRIACFPTFGRRYVIPVVARMAELYPALRVELDLTERLADPVADRLDAMIRIGSLADSNLIATRVARQTRILCVSENYLGRVTAAPQTVEELHAHCLIDKLHGNDLLGWRDVLGQPICNGQAVFRCNDFEAMFQAVNAGMGIAWLPDWVVGPAIKEGQLIQLLPEVSAQPCMQTDIHVLRALAQPTVKLRTFIDELKKYIGMPELWSLHCELSKEPQAQTVMLQV